MTSSFATVQGNNKNQPTSASFRLNSKNGIFNMGSLSGKGNSVVERMANAFSKCSAGVGANIPPAANKTDNNALHATANKSPPAVPEKPSRIQSLKNKLGNKVAVGTGTYGNGFFGRSPKPVKKIIKMLEIRTKKYVTWSELWQEEEFLLRFFQYFEPAERRDLAQVCRRWRDILYTRSNHWNSLVAVLEYKSLGDSDPNGNDEIRMRHYESIQTRGFDAVCLVQATDADVKELAGFLSDRGCTRPIRSLSFRRSTVTDVGLQHLMEFLPALHQLEMISCNEVTEAGLWSALSPKIVSLSISDCINIGDECIRAITHKLPSLYEFSIQAYHMTDHALAYFSPKQTNTLSILKLHSCWEITNHGLLNLVGAVPNLTCLSLSGCSKVTDEGIELVAENLRHLRSLDLSWCPRITDAALEYIACDLTSLEELILDRSLLVTDIGVGYLCTMLSLTSLSLRWCTQIRDFGVQHLCNMKNLQILSLAGCNQLTPGGLCTLAQLPHLMELELTNCPGATPELIDFLQENMPRCTIFG
ncbi:unnamed protein product [Darwinula stevensoni]|uniref:F-box/LRR-repeat protein 16 n=1 Tax=Darwinula stevensoni TaxID=69355 RepID=A0A7R9A5D1_9CRUS|nr:unnamed protein product [Darwinula stevensoni]CAG0886229.1 unnamed protein product [Darwinula stevensoni]